MRDKAPTHDEKEDCPSETPTSHSPERDTGATQSRSGIHERQSVMWKAGLQRTMLDATVKKTYRDQEKYYLRKYKYIDGSR